MCLSCGLADQAKIYQDWQMCVFASPSYEITECHCRQRCSDVELSFSPEEHFRTCPLYLSSRLALCRRCCQLLGAFGQHVHNTTTSCRTAGSRAISHHVLAMLLRASGRRSARRGRPGVPREPMPRRVWFRHQHLPGPLTGDQWRTGNMCRIPEIVQSAKESCDFQHPPAMLLKASGRRSAGRAALESRANVFRGALFPPPALTWLPTVGKWLTGNICRIQGIMVNA